MKMRNKTENRDARELKKMVAACGLMLIPADLYLDMVFHGGCPHLLDIAARIDLLVKSPAQACEQGEYPFTEAGLDTLAEQLVLEIGMPPVFPVNQEYHALRGQLFEVAAINAARLKHRAAPF